MQFSTLIRTRIEHLRNQRRSRAQIEANQLKKFRRLAAYAAKHSPYYRDIVERRGIDLERCVPQDFPVLTKTILLDNFDRIATDPAVTQARITDFLQRSRDPAELFDGRFWVVRTSGSSGRMGYFVFSRAAWARGVAGALRVNPPSFGKRRLAVFGTSDDHYTSVSFAVTCRRWPLSLAYDVAVCEINAPLVQTVDKLNAFQPTILMGYPSAFAMLADKQLEGQLRIKPKYVQCSGEPLLAQDRERIEQAFGVPVLNVYSCSEHLLMGVSGTDDGGMYLFEDDLIFEFDSDHTRITNLFNYVMPLIRYRNDDVLLPQPDRQSALPFTRVADIIARREHTPVFVNDHGAEDFINPAVITGYFVKGVRRHQLQLVDKTNCLLRICLVDGLNAEEREETRRAAHARFGELLAQKEMRNVGYRVEVVDDMPPDPKTGKFSLIVPRYGDLDAGGPTQDLAQGDAASDAIPLKPTLAQVSRQNAMHG